MLHALNRFPPFPFKEEQITPAHRSTSRCFVSFGERCVAGFGLACCPAALRPLQLDRLIAAVAAVVAVVRPAATGTH